MSQEISHLLEKKKVQNQPAETSKALEVGAPVPGGRGSSFSLVPMRGALDPDIPTTTEEVCGGEGRGQAPGEGLAGSTALPRGGRECLKPLLIAFF